MIILNLFGFICFVPDLRCSSISLSFNDLLSVVLIAKLLQFNLIGVGNTRGLIPFSAILTSPIRSIAPHTHQQNGDAECKHRHIVDMGLALLAHASIPLKYWDEAFLVVTYLINRTPTKILSHDTPLHKLLGANPNYSSFHVFGCAC
jgi:hypothetical protein